jgi:hypothetical protein
MLEDEDAMIVCDCECNFLIINKFQDVISEQVAKIQANKQEREEKWWLHLTVEEPAPP